MSESNDVANFAPSIKFVAAVYTVEISIGLLVVVWLLSRAPP